MTARNGAAAPHRRETDDTGETGMPAPATAINERLNTKTIVAMNDASPAAGARTCGLSVRAVNVLKLLATELTGECPPRENWAPTTELLREITLRRLLAARNCGPLTAREIIRWAESRGVSMQPVFHAGKSLSATWRDLDVKFTAGELTKAEVAEALEKSVRRKSSRIPITVQKILLKLLTPASERFRT